MSRVRKLPIALTVAGSDSGGGAGIQADLKTFAALGVHGTSAITCITAQNPARVMGIQACRPDIVRQEIEAVFTELPPAAMKTGMLYSPEIIRVVVACLREVERLPVVVDPVMVSSGGEPLVKAAAIECLKDRLLPLAALVTPNLPETEVLLDRRLLSMEDMRKAARLLHREWGCAALVKGGHLPNAREAADILYDGRNEWLLKAPFVKGVKTHGTGCTYSAAIAGYLALGCRLPVAVARAKGFISQAIARYRVAGRHAVLDTISRYRISGAR